MALPIVNLNFIPRFPAAVVGDGPITVDKTGMVYTFGFDLTRYILNPTPEPSSQVLAYNPVTQVAETIPAAGFPVDWSGILNKPTTFPPTLPIAIGGVSGLQTSLDSKIAIADIGTTVQAYDADLSALAANSTNGLWARTGAGTGAARTLTGTTNVITVTNGDGLGGNPTLTTGPLVARTDTANSFTAQQSSTLATLTDGASISWDVSTRQKAKVTLAGNRTMSAVTNAVEGSSYFLWIIQDATGSRTMTWTTSGAGSFDFGTDGAPTLTTTASRADLLCFEAITIGGTLKLRYAGIKKGFA